MPDPSIVPDLVTARQELYRPTPADTEGLFAIFSDPLVWLHYPSLRHRHPDQTRAMLAVWLTSWQTHGLGSWVVRLPGEDGIVGCCGCNVLRGQVWNLGYRFAADQHGRGLATEAAAAAVARAGQVNPALPIVAYLVAHNRASARVAEKVGLRVVHTLPDPGNPDPSVRRLVYADRALTAPQRAATEE